MTAPFMLTVFTMPASDAKVRATLSKMPATASPAKRAAPESQEERNMRLALDQEPPRVTGLEFVWGFENQDETDEAVSLLGTAGVDAIFETVESASARGQFGLVEAKSPGASVAEWDYLRFGFICRIRRDSNGTPTGDASAAVSVAVRRDALLKAWWRAQE